MINIRRMACATVLALLAGQVEARPDYYAREKQFCNIHDDRLVSVGAGEFRIYEQHFSRVSKKRNLKGGWFEAHYKFMEEGYDNGVMKLKIRLSPKKLEIVADDGSIVTWVRCTNL